MRERTHEEYVGLFDQDDEDAELPDHVFSADWKADATHLFDLMDLQLEPHGLEIVQYDTRGDWYVWAIEPREDT